MHTLHGLRLGVGNHHALLFGLPVGEIPQISGWLYPGRVAKKNLAIAVLLPAEKELPTFLTYLRFPPRWVFEGRRQSRVHHGVVLLCTQCRFGYLIWSNVDSYGSQLGGHLILACIRAPLLGRVGVVLFFLFSMYSLYDRFIITYLEYYVNVFEGELLIHFLRIN